MSKEYIEQLERENILLKKRLEEADFKANCYDVIMYNVIRSSNSGFISHSTITTDTSENIKGINLRVELKVDKSSYVVMKIINDFIEDEKAMAGSKKR